MNNAIYIRRKGKLYLERDINTLPDDYLFNLLKNIEPLGYPFSPELTQAVKTLSVESITTLYMGLKTAA